MSIDTDIKHKLLLYIFCIYLEVVKKLSNFGQDDNAKVRIGKVYLWCKIQYLNHDLSNIAVSMQKVLKTNISDEERSRLEKYNNDLLSVSIFLEQSAHLDVDGLVDSLLTTQSVISEYMTDILNKAAVNKENVNDFEYELWEIAYETVYAFQKFTLFILDHFNVEHSFHAYKQVTEIYISKLKETLDDFNNEIVMEEFVHYTNCSLQYLENYLDYIKEISENENMSEESKKLLSTVCTYIPRHISIVADAINAENPIENLLSVLDEFRSTVLSALESVIDMVKSRSTDNENDANELVQHAILFFLETLQNIKGIDEIGTFKSFNP